MYYKIHDVRALESRQLILMPRQRANYQVISRKASDLLDWAEQVLEFWLVRTGFWFQTYRIWLARNPLLRWWDGGAEGTHKNNKQAYLYCKQSPHLVCAYKMWGLIILYIFEKTRNQSIKSGILFSVVGFEAKRLHSNLQSEWCFWKRRSITFIYLPARWIFWIYLCII